MINFQKSSKKVVLLFCSCCILFHEIIGCNQATWSKYSFNPTTFQFSTTKLSAGLQKLFFSQYFNFLPWICICWYSSLLRHELRRKLNALECWFFSLQSSYTYVGHIEITTRESIILWYILLWKACKKHCKL